MGYVRNNSRDYLARLQNQKAIAAAELAHEERRLQQIRETEMEIARIEHKRLVVRDQIKEATASTKHRMPPPIHGGPKGLLEAAKESAAYDKRRRQTQDA